MGFSIWTAKLNKGRGLKRQDWLIILLAGILLLVIAVPTGGSSGSSETKNTASTQETDESRAGKGDTYVKDLERQLKELLGNIDGVGKVEVMITLKDEGESILDKDISSDEKSYDEKTVVFDDGTGDAPYVTRENVPGIEGIVIVAEGGNSAAVKTEVAEAVMALFQVEAHKIKVLPMKS